MALIPMKSHIELKKSCSLSIPFGTGAPEAQSGLGSAPLLAPRWAGHSTHLGLRGCSWPSVTLLLAAGAGAVPRRV